ncbi:hypothetical protein SFK315_1736 [Shigella flexneri K-315]|uniref:Uncharacterized protein n=1 Tax=Shigella flexneri K-315 TaxID=766150 RepID=I6CVN5_SHIFL|nr:hypothetical protein SFK315_1736 [Shigella flexneri K-315]
MISEVQYDAQPSQLSETGVNQPSQTSGIGAILPSQASTLREVVNKNWPPS